MDYADRHRKELSSINNLEELGKRFLPKPPSMQEFLAYLRKQGIRPVSSQWEECGDILMTQIKAYIGRNTRLEDNGFYPYLGKIDNVLQKALEVLYVPLITELPESGFVLAPIRSNLDE